MAAKWDSYMAQYGGSSHLIRSVSYYEGEGRESGGVGEREGERERGG